MAVVNGFECEFVEKPPKAVQSECPICLLVLREPYQATCCGKSFCKECIERSKAGSKRCPTCKTENFFSYPNKGLQQSLNDFEVYCSHKSKGCEWRGELRELDKHLNSDPPADKSLEGCPFTVISCPLNCATCTMKKPRNEVVIHVNSGALMRRVLQQEGRIKFLEDTLHYYQNDRKLLQQLVRDKLSLEQHVVKLERHNTELQRQVSELMVNRDTFGESSPGLARIVMTEYNQHKRGNDKWYSRPFFSGPRGYKMCLEVVAKGYSTACGTHLSVYVHLMRGQNDGYLKWPFLGDVEIHLLDQESEDHVYSKIVSYTRECSASVLGKGSEVTKGHGFRHFIPLSDLERGYLKDDRLCFRIKKVTLKQT